jgi:molybdopterin-binding protein
MEISARNVFKGTVKSIKYGQILAELVIELPGGVEITSLITKTSAERMGLAEGKEVATVIKASNVMVALE